jgi:SAM-dependent methyltransferase
VSTPWIFDQAHYGALNTAREHMLRSLLPELKQRFDLKTALDLGCGVGHFAHFLHSFGLNVLAIDGRTENVEEAKRRYPDVNFQLGDAQEATLPQLGSFDLVFCFGLLYHLENPFRVIRSIAALATKVALVESVVYPSSVPAMVLMDESNSLDQGLDHVAFYPSESCLIKMFHLADFSNCYSPDNMPEHDGYRLGSNGFRQRTVLVASKRPIDSSGFVSLPRNPTFGPWAMMPLYPARRIVAAYRLFDRLFRDERS